MASIYSYIDKHQEPDPSQLFLVRIWPDQDRDSNGGWTGKIQHVLSGEVQQFEDWASLGKHLQSMLAQEDKGR